MFIGDVVNGGALPVLELTAKFAARRQAVLAHNIANLSTPGFQPTEVSPQGFQRLLGDAIARRRESGGGPLDWRATREIARDGDGLRLEPRTVSRNILFHDRNNRDLERMMADQVENVGVFRVATDLLRSRYQLIGSALAERV